MINYFFCLIDRQKALNIMSWQTRGQKFSPFLQTGFKDALNLSPSSGNEVLE